MKINFRPLIEKLSFICNFSFLVKFLINWLPTRANRVFMIFEGREYTYREVYKESQRYASYFMALRNDQVKKGILKDGRRLHIAIYQENTPEFVFILFGAAMSDTTIFGINTGFRGETLVNVINQANIALLLADSTTVKEVKRILPEIKSLQDKDLVLVGDIAEEDKGGVKKIDELISDYEYDSSKPPKVKIDNFSPLMVI